MKPETQPAPKAVPRLVIHVGPPKTGTTYLQSNFYRLRATLADCSVIYPVIGDRRANAHHEVAALIKAGKVQPSPVFKRLKAAAAKARGRGADLLLSSENFNRIGPDGLAALATALGYRRVTIVHVLRDPFEMLGSVWAERVKNGHDEPLDRFVARALAAPEQSDTLNPLTRLDALAAHKAIDLVVLDARALRETGTDLFTGFMRDVFGHAGLAPADDVSANPRPAPELIELIRRLSPYGEAVRETYGMMLGRAVERRLPEALRSAALAAIAARQDALETLTVSDPSGWSAILSTRLAERHGPRIVPFQSMNAAKPVRLVHYRQSVLDSDPAVQNHVAKAGARLQSGSRSDKALTALKSVWRRVKRFAGRLTGR